MKEKKIMIVFNKLTFISFIGFSLACILSAAIFIPYYLERVKKVELHTYVLESVCYSDIIPDDIILDRLLHAGLNTNCLESEIYVNTPILLGALKDLWRQTPIYYVMYAESWQLQLVYVAGGLFCMFFGFRYLFKGHLISMFVEKGMGVLESKLNFGDGKRRLLVNKNITPTKSFTIHSNVESSPQTKNVDVDANVDLSSSSTSTFTEHTFKLPSPSPSPL